MDKQMMSMDELEQVNGGFVDEVVDGVEYVGEKIVDGMQWVNDTEQAIEKKVYEVTEKVAETIADAILSLF